MGNEYQEKDFDDEVYEDEYYEEHYDEEELTDESENIFDSDSPGKSVEKDEDEDDEDDDLDDDDDETDEEFDWENNKRITMSFACEECDYRWDDTIIKRKGNLEDEEQEVEAICPMCGSMNITQI